MATTLCARCRDKIGKDHWWATHDGVKEPVCVYCFDQLRSYQWGMPKQEWYDEPIHKYMERVGI